MTPQAGWQGWQKGLGGPAAPAPRLFAFTDPKRTPDLQGLAMRLPTGSGLVLRTFGRAAIEAEAPGPGRARPRQRSGFIGRWRSGLACDAGRPAFIGRSQGWAWPPAGAAGSP